MKIKSILAALLMMVVGMQTADAQGFRVYNSDGTVMQFSFRTDSIVFYDGIGSDVDFGPYTPVNQMIVGTWYLSKTETVTFREDGTTDYMGGTTYKFFPLQGNIVFYNAVNTPVSIFKVVELTEERMIVNGNNFLVLTRTQPSQLVTAIVLSETAFILQPDKTKRLTATVYPYDADNMDVTWESSDETVAMVINNGLVVAVGDGTCTITCRATDGSGVYAECLVKVGFIDNIAITCEEAVQQATALENGATSVEIYTVIGYITEVVGNVSRNQQTFWMADTKNGGRILEAYWANLPEGITEFKVGMKVVITGQLIKYVLYDIVVYEMKNANVVILEDGDGGGGDTPPVEGTDVTCAEAVQLTNALSDGATSTETYSVTGYITSILGNVSRNQQSFWMADTKDGGQVFEAYWANLPSDVSTFAVGMKVKITGQLMKYVKDGQVTPEIKNADVVILENSDGGGDDPDPGTNPSGDPITNLVNGDFESWVSDTQPTGWKSACSASNAELGKSTEAHGGSFACVVKAPGTANKRLATQEITLQAGNYTFSFYAKSTTADASQTRGGYVPVADGSVGAYKYGDYVNLNNSEWTLVSYDFELTAPTTLCLLVMNPKGSSYSISQDILVDDSILTKK